MLCKAIKVILAVLIVSLIALPISLVFGSTMALITLVLAILYITDE